jgi:MFS family permease
MLVVLYFHQLGYSPLQVALLFLFYEIFGVIANLVGGWLGARIGPDRTMTLGVAADRRTGHADGADSVAHGTLGNGRPSALRCRERPQQDELQEQHQAVGATGRLPDGKAAFGWAAAPWSLLAWRCY